MHKHILMPTDGSRLAAKGIREGVRLAGALAAKITGTYVIAPFTPPAFSEGTMFYAGGLSPGVYKRFTQKKANRALGAIKRAARTAGVRCDTRFVTDAQPWQGILRIARTRKCDTIVMALNGRGAVGGLLLRSETSGALARATIPVLVVR